MNLFFIKKQYTYKKKQLWSVFWALLVASAFLSISVGLTDSVNYKYLDIINDRYNLTDFVISKSSSMDLFFDQKVVDTLNTDPSMSDLRFGGQLCIPVYHSVNTSNIRAVLIGIDIPTDPTQLRRANGTSFTTHIPNSTCLILKSTADLWGVSIGDWLTIQTHIDTIDVIIYQVIADAENVPFSDTPLIWMNLAWMQHFMRLPNQINIVHGAFRDPFIHYDLSDLASTMACINTYSSNIANVFGPSYLVLNVKLVLLQAHSESVVYYSFLFKFIIFASIFTFFLLSYVVIASLLQSFKTDQFTLESVGVSSRSQRQILFILAGIPSITGLVMGTIVGSLVNYILFSMILSGFTIFFSIGSGCITILGAIMLHSRTTKSDDNTELTYIMAGQQNKKWFMIGLSINIFGILIFGILPRVMLEQSPIWMIMFIAILIASLLAGFMLLGIGIIPYISTYIAQWIVLPFRLYLQKSLHYYQYHFQKIFAVAILLLTSISFLTSFTLMLNSSTQQSMASQIGSDIALYNYGTIETNIPTALVDEMRAHPSILHSVNLYSTAYRSVPLTSIYYGLSQALPTTKISRRNTFDQITCSVTGIEPAYWNITESAINVTTLYTTNNTCILSRGIAESLEVVVGTDLILFKGSHMYIFTVIAIISTLPAVPGCFTNLLSISQTYPAVIVSDTVFQSIFVNDPFVLTPYTSLFWVNQSYDITATAIRFNNYFSTSYTSYLQNYPDQLLALQTTQIVLNLTIGFIVVLSIIIIMKITNTLYHQFLLYRSRELMNLHSIGIPFDVINKKERRIYLSLVFGYSLLAGIVIAGLAFKNLQVFLLF